MKNSKSVMNEKLKKVSCKNFYSKTSNSFFWIKLLQLSWKNSEKWKPCWKTVKEDCESRRYLALLLHMRVRKWPRVITTSWLKCRNRCIENNNHRKTQKHTVSFSYFWISCKLILRILNFYSKHQIFFWIQLFQLSKFLLST